MSGLTGRLNPVLWLGLPALACAAGSLVLATPVRIFNLGLPEPVFALVPAFAWAVIRPSVLPPFVLVALGLFLDALWGGPFGLWPLCLLAAYAPVLMARAFLTGQDFVVLWVWYAAACALAFGVGFVVISARAERAAWRWSAARLVQFLVSAALFPLAHRLIVRYEDADVRFR